MCRIVTPAVKPTDHPAMGLVAPRTGLPGRHQGTRAAPSGVLGPQQDRSARAGHPRGDRRWTVRSCDRSPPPLALGAAALVIALSAGPALACGGLIGPNGAVNLLQTTTLAGYHDGEEHYITAFQFAGGGGAFGSLTPLPGIPSSVEKGGDWTLQRLVRETDPVPEFDARARRGRRVPAPAEELMKVRIDALDVTVLRGGSTAVGQWATEHGFRLPPDAPEVLDFYAARSPIFLAAVFDADAAAARGQAVGDGTPVHVTIPTDNPWVPLRILALGKTPAERVDRRRLPADRPDARPAAGPDRRRTA